MNKTVKWISNLFVNVFFTMLAMWTIKKVSIEWELPFFKKMSEEL